MPPPEPPLKSLCIMDHYHGGWRCRYRLLAAPFGPNGRLSSPIRLIDNKFHGLSLSGSPLTFVWPGVPKQRVTTAPSSQSKHHLMVFCIDEIVPGHGLGTPSEEIAFTARPKFYSQSQIFRYGWSIFCLPHWPKFSNFFVLCLHWVSVVRVLGYFVYLVN